MASGISAVFKKWPILRGMATFGLIWPASSLCQQAIEGRKEFDFARVARFSFFGSCIVGPHVHAWIKFASWAVPGTTLKAAVTKALMEQVCYHPFGVSIFYSGMTLLEGKSWEEAKKEVKAKFWPTYCTGMCVWPIIQTINFAFVPEKNRVVVSSIYSFFWSTFLSYMKTKQQ